MSSLWRNLVYNGTSYSSEEGTHRMHWDKTGSYCGQYQANMLDDEGLDELFISPRADYSGEFDLSEAEMDEAREYHSRECSPVFFK